jgi:putative Mn2+ efflux pump MntP
VLSPALLGLILRLALDTFAVSAAVGLTGPTRRQQLRLSALLRSSRAVCQRSGSCSGHPPGEALGPTADYLAIVILIGFGTYTLLRGGGDDARAARMTTAHGPTLILIGLSVSLDELAVGFTLGLLRVPMLPFLVAIGLQAFDASQVGFGLGASMSERFRGGRAPGGDRPHCPRSHPPGRAHLLGGHRPRLCTGRSTPLGGSDTLRVTGGRS